MAAELDIVGLAGTARGLVPEAITAEVEPALAVLAAISPRLMQFKVCSTFDSSCHGEYWPRAGSGPAALARVCFARVTCYARFRSFHSVFASFYVLGVKSAG